MTRPSRAPSLALLAAAALACRSDRSPETASPRATDPPPRASADKPAKSEPPTQPRPARDDKPSTSEPGRLAGITAAHNKVRDPLGLPALIWSDDLARFAQTWADKLKRKGCQLNHRPRSGPDAQKYGENIYSSTGHAPTAADVVDTWAAEVADYNAKTGRCKGVCGHYTQIVWRKSQRVGCGMAACGDTEVWVCNYDPPGNFLGQKPY
jgi:pathogenesis-related protein 1